MALAIYTRSPFGIAKRLRINGMRASPLAVSSRLPPQPNPQIIDSRVDFITTLRSRQADLRPTRSFPPVIPEQDPFTTISSIARLGDEPSRQLPLSAGAVYLRPLKRHAQYGLPACDLQLRSYNVRNVEFFADFALRAAYYLYLPAVGPIPLPRITERWTVPRSNFVHKKSQENFERITIRRLIQVQDGHPETVEIWLAFLRKHAYYGIGMKANVWEHAKLGVGKTMDVSIENLKRVLEPKWAHVGRKKNLDTSEKVMEMMENDQFRRTADGPLSSM